MFEENVFAQVCEQAHNPANITYFNQHPGGVQNNTLLAEEGTTLIDHNDLNCLTLDLNGYIGRYLKIQVELLDSYKTIHKPGLCT